MKLRLRHLRKENPEPRALVVEDTRADRRLLWEIPQGELSKRDIVSFLRKMALELENDRTL